MAGVGTITAWGAWTGFLHGVVASLASLAVQGAIDEVSAAVIAFAFITLPIGAAVALIAAILTVPAAIRAARAGWGRMRPFVVAGPPIVIVLVAFYLAQPWPFGRDTRPWDVAELVNNLVWFHVGPACWAGWVLYRVTGRWHDRTARGRSRSV